jgi:hypothetical protein
LFAAPCVQPLIKSVPAWLRTTLSHFGPQGDAPPPTGVQPAANDAEPIAAPVDGPGHDLLPLTGQDAVTGYTYTGRAWQL